MADTEVTTPPPSDEVQLTLSHQGNRLKFNFPPDATLLELSSHIATELSISASNQKFVISPKPGLIKPPFADSPHATLTAAELSKRKIILLGNTDAAINALNTSIRAAQAQTARRQGTYTGALKPAKPARTRDPKRTLEEATYTFHKIQPLPHLPAPERSGRFLARLADDAGIKAAMIKHKFSVGLLTEMDPAEHTTHESRTLGLNQNRGEAILLRLRTDAYDGYRDYRTIRKTLCHELAHNVHGEHDRSFWDLCHEIEREVERNDWRRGGRALTDEEFYNPHDGGFDEAVADHGAWIGEGSVLGSAASASGGSEAGAATAPAGDATARREALARAAEDRLKKQREQQQGNGSQPGPS